MLLARIDEVVMCVVVVDEEQEETLLKEALPPAVALSKDITESG